MEAFHPFPSPSFNLSILRTKHSIPFKKPIFSLPFKHPKSHLFSIFKDKNQFKIFSTATSSTISTTDTEPTAPDLEFEEEKEKFDWYSNWYPIMPVCDLDKKVPHAKTVMGLDVVVWWDRMEEKWQVFDDRCPHRLAPLSEGRIDQWGRLQCVYHGWCFDGAGDCKLIPQAPLDGPPINTFKKACAAVYPSCEQNKIVWFWPSTEPQFKDILMKEKPPYIPELDDPSYTSLYGNRDIPYGYEVLVENLMDPAHVPYAHYGIMRIPNAKNRPKRDREGGRPMEISVETLNGNGFFANQGFGYSKFMAPCIFYAFPKSAPSYELSTSMSIEQERKIAEVGPSNWQKACFVPTKSDALVVGFRKWLRKYAGGQIKWGNKFDVGLLPIPPREQLLDRYWSHVVNCSSCRVAVKGLKALEVSLQVISLASIAIVAALKQNVMSTVSRSVVVSMAVVCFLASKWLSHFIYKNFYYHDYNHALK